MVDTHKQRIADLEDTLKQRDSRIAELREEIDEQRDLISRLREHAESYTNCMQSWKDTFDMEETETGVWTREPFWKEHSELLDDYNDLVRRWNKCLPRINGEPRNVGRPLAASETQCVQVLKMHKGGDSLRAIAEETSLGLRTVRTIVEQKRGSDRTIKKHRGRLDISGALITWKRQRRSGEHLPKRVQRVVEEGEALIKEARGVGHSR